jgi:micrococcal nuclease
MTKLIALLFVAITTICCAPQVGAADTPPRVPAVVTRVIDGDTIQVRLVNRRIVTVRYIGMNAPESTRQQECYGKQASAVNKSLVMTYTVAVSNTVWLEKDVSETDRYGRLLRYVYLPDGRMVNEVLVEMGYAQAATYPPDVKYQERFIAAQRVAIENGAGLWTGCAVRTAPLPAVTPAPTGVGCPQGCTTMSEGCRIKGNISSSKERIYHMPGQRDYEKTVISPVKGERWFCTEAEAVANGWRRAMR